MSLHMQKHCAFEVHRIQFWAQSIHTSCVARTSDQIIGGSNCQVIKESWIIGLNADATESG